MEQSRRRGSGAFGWLLFALIIFAPRLAGPLSNWLAQNLGITVAPGTIIAGMIGLYVLSAVLAPALRALGRSRGAGDTRLPAPPPTSSAPPRPIAPPRPAAPPAPRSTPPPRLPPGPTTGPAMRFPDGPSPLPGPPRFEPIIDPRVLTFGIVGLLALGAFLLVLFFLAGSLP